MTHSRRQMLRILGAGAALGLAGLALRSRPQTVHWQGEALGALAAITLWHPRPAHARATLVRVEAELGRLARIFDLHDRASEIARLNTSGTLEHPSTDLLEVLGAAREMAERSGGGFDPTVQPLWLARSLRPGDGRALDAARTLVGHAAVDTGPGRIRFGRAGMQLTLNGIAQGHVADRIAMILKSEGFDEALIDAGEIRAIGWGPDGGGHALGRVDPTAPTRIAGTLRLGDGALAVSGGYGMRLPDGGHHILDPRSGQSVDGIIETIVSHPRAITADGLSTALHVVGADRAGALVAAHPGAAARIMLADGRVLRFGAGPASEA